MMFYWLLGVTTHEMKPELVVNSGNVRLLVSRSGAVRVAGAA
jgi:hypothetical protein